MLVKNKELHKTICEECLNNSLSVFHPLSDSEKIFLQDKILSFVYKKNERIYEEGEKPVGLIYLVHGKVKLTKTGVGGREQIVRMASSHGFIGYRAVFAQERTIASATALEDTSTCMIPIEFATELIHSNSHFALNIIRSFAMDLGFSDSRTVTLTQKHIRGRLAESLLLLMKEYGTEEDGKTLKVLLSREDVAKLSNMTPSNAIRTLSAFAAEKVIALEGRKILILNAKQLDMISRLG